MCCFVGVVGVYDIMKICFSRLEIIFYFSIVIICDQIYEFRYGVLVILWWVKCVFLYKLMWRKDNKVSNSSVNLIRWVCKYCEDGRVWMIK